MVVGVACCRFSWVGLWFVGLLSFVTCLYVLLVACGRWLFGLLLRLVFGGLRVFVLLHGDLCTTWFSGYCWGLPVFAGVGAVLDY